MYCARKLLYRERVVQRLGPRGYFAWEQARRRAVTRKTFKVWDEMELPSEFPRVYFYCHHVTHVCSWDKPKEWRAFDKAQDVERRQLMRWGYTLATRDAATHLQRLWRARQARISFRLIMKSVQLMKASEHEYLQDPTNLVKMGNYVLFLHAILHDYERARPLYGRLMRTMAQRGPDVPFILFSYGIFLYVTQDDDVGLVEEMIYRGKLKDRQLIKYKMAFLGFFRQSMIQNPRDAESNLNYAACLQWLFDQYEESTKYYLRAIAANPHRRGIMDLFQDMLDRKRTIDKAKNPARFKKPPGAKRTREEDDELRVQYDAYEQFRRWQVTQAEEDDRQRRLAYEAERNARARLEAAKKIQARYRRRRAMRAVNRVKLDRQIAQSIAELAHQKAIHERVTRAFEDVSAEIKPTKTKGLWKASGGKSSAESKNKVISVPMSLAQSVFQKLNLSVSPDDLNEAVNTFVQQHASAKNINVMDVTTFIQTHPVLGGKISTGKTT
ncbi:hypothetical protein PINS_up010413 [Pythium insidiosum]|nr:hypothetical protein PINS_up010413 [Pythium insidiosum]